MCLQFVCREPASLQFLGVSGCRFYLVRRPASVPSSEATRADYCSSWRRGAAGASLFSACRRVSGAVCREPGRPGDRVQQSQHARARARRLARTHCLPRPLPLPAEPRGLGLPHPAPRSLCSCQEERSPRRAQPPEETQRHLWAATPPAQPRSPGSKMRLSPAELGAGPGESLAAAPTYLRALLGSGSFSAAAKSSWCPGPRPTISGFLLRREDCA
ncbi:uncharacterized protein LOC106027375 [Cavia porcellus]|uniref:uncharacterized protein LOC106027375 n=1 Tax=Cavia porcellus TaxID=10141 RepID=UPI002FDF211C